MARVSEDFSNHPLKDVKFDTITYVSEQAVSKCRCVKCKNVPFVVQAYLHAKCGHLVCKNCYPDGDKAGITHTCDLCQQPGPVASIPTQDVIKALSKLEVFCPNFDKGCHVLFTVSNYLAHQTNCSKPGDPDKQKVEDAIRTGDIEGAKDALRTFEKIKRNDPAINVLGERIKVSEKEGKLTMSYMGKLRYPMALEHATKMLQDSYDCIKFISIKAECFIHLGQIQEAQVLYQKLMSPHATNNSDVMYIDALLRFNRAQFPEAIKICEAILKDEEHEKAKILKVQVEKVNFSLKTSREKIRRRAFQEAQQALMEGFRNTNETNKLVYAQLLECRAMASLQLSAYIDAVADCRRAIEYDPNRLQTLLLSIEGNIGMEEFNRALEDGELVYTLKKEDKDVRQHFFSAILNWENHTKLKYNGKYMDQAEVLRKEFPQMKPKEPRKKVIPGEGAKKDGGNGDAGNDKKDGGNGAAGDRKLTKQDIIMQFEKEYARVMAANEPWEIAGLQQGAPNPQIISALKGLIKILHTDNYKGDKIPAGDRDKAFKKVRKTSNDLKNK